MRSNYQPRRKGIELFFYCFIITINQTKRVENVGKGGKRGREGERRGEYYGKRGVLYSETRRGVRGQ